MRGGFPLAVLLAIGTRPLSSQADSAWATHQRIAGDVIRGAGATRLSDILFLADDWDLSTVDGFSWDVSVRGLSSFDRQTWQVMVDGTPMDLSPFGAMNVNRLPVLIDQIDFVEIVSVPQFHEGVFAVGGIMHIHTAQPAPGLSARARWTAGNEVGDPGPFIFTPLRSRNIEQTGPDYSGTVSYSGAHFYVEASHNTLHHILSKPAIGPRNLIISDGGFGTEIISTGIAARVGTSVLGGRVEGFFRESDTEDFFFLKAFGRELPLRNTFRAIGITGSARPADAYTLRYSVTHFVNQLRGARNLLDLDYDWRRRSVGVSLAGVRHANDVQVELGVKVLNVAADTRYQLTESGFTTGTVYSIAKHQLAPRIRQQLGGSVVVSRGGDIGFNASANYRFRIDGRNAIDANLTYSRRLPEQDGRIWYWRDRGYGFLDDAGVAVATDGTIGAYRQLAADIAWSRKLGGKARLRVSSFLRAVGGLHVEDQQFAFRASDLSFGSPVRLTANQAYEAIGGDVTVRWDRTPRWQMRFYYRFQHVQGDSLIADMWEAIPRHRLQWWVHLTPAPGFGLWGKLGYGSRANWPAFSGIDGQTIPEHTYSSAFGGVTSLDFALVKWLAKGIVRATLGVRNVLNDTISYHPIGATFDMNMFFQGEIRLNSLLGPRS